MLRRYLLMRRSVRKNWPDVAFVALTGGWVFCILRVREAPYAYQSLLSLGSFWLLPQRTRMSKNLSMGGQ
jgi:hypothetical protein